MKDFDAAARALLGWYDKNKRSLPWREISDVYAVLVSEMMLQQTRVDTVVGYYTRFMQRFPTAQTLAGADEADVLHAWQGLGYYSRARNLKKAAGVLAEQGIPQTLEQWRRVPGVGPYIAGAVMSIAQGMPQPAVDGNVLRVIARLFGSRDDISQPAAKKQTTQRVRAMMPPGRAGDFTQALMELGAMVCIPSQPRCENCPLAAQCEALRSGTVGEIPVKAPRAKPKTQRLWAALATTDTHILMAQRVDETLLKNMWGVPVVEKKRGASPETLIAQKYGIELAGGSRAGEVSHVFTHRRWEMDVIRCLAAERFEAPDPLRWIALDAIGDIAIPTAFKKVLALAGGEERKQGENDR